MMSHLGSDLSFERLSQLGLGGQSLSGLLCFLRGMVLCLGGALNQLLLMLFFVDHFVFW
uniref:Uncharacterized protein n=1 Tax=Brassica oleracea var. oleracea TaxID=109376 RepID=A0A0D3D8N7_BRAOL